MTVETATYLSQLNVSYPAFDDGKAEGDDHIRLLKTVLKNTFPNLGRALAATQAKNGNFSVNVSDAYGTYLFTAALDAQLPTAASAGSGFMVWFKAVTGSSTITPAGAELINGLNSPLSVQEGDMGWFLCTGSAWHAGFVGTLSIAGQVAAAAASAAAAATSESNAATSETNAATSASNASTSASSASTSASTATTQASNASTSASNAATSASNASTSASTASTQATNAANSASAASTSATNAANSASAAATSASNAATSESNAATSASNAATSASNASTSASDAAASAAVVAWTVTSTATTKTVVNGEHVVVTAAGQTINAPAVHSAGDRFRVEVGNFVNTTVSGNGSNIVGANGLSVASYTHDLNGRALEHVSNGTTWRIV